MTVAWWQLDLQVPAEAAAAVEAQLLEAGADAITFLEQDASEALFVAGELWQNSHCQALFAADAHAEADLRALIERAAWQQYGASLQAVADQDWVSRTQAQFPARQFGKLWVVPSWDRAPEDAPYELHLDPGQAFGTGAHPTTSRCLHFLESHIRGGECVIDYGCGSGILAIAALLLGAKIAYGVDTDPQALKVAMVNAERNGVIEQFQLSLPEQNPLPQADILVANILAGPLLQLAATLAALTKPGGWIALSGILHSQEAGIQEAYAPYFNFAMPQHEEDWSLLYGQRKSGD
ncbi:50S ribosomal protein L11 methyltransferase [Acidithiobacillus montserratensis]|uniref:50S ribosomal protein L11 methyltransferase n=1 Tax=Acidithiobacillus montserratensis TaxID=2729135 RepID=A0ACD5HFH0_9PROT|nr:50S ribosomal protein L11 methyltransferase [Acidithiobacillus montserratensis]MBN2680081.1 50S ribosomal protein L11 methyltransferase [Acidithiobacillaceae bacterium]MBU2747890.1 50S ribosomal protein L11 methyltransferase [Acidithiobacillus montserratensis]